MTPEQVMSFLIQDNDLSSVLEKDDLIEGATAALWLVIDQIIWGYEQSDAG